MNMTDYEETRRTFRLHVPDDYEFTRDVVEHWAADAPRAASPTLSRGSASRPVSAPS